jgi:hypothetical protein
VTVPAYLYQLPESVPDGKCLVHNCVYPVACRPGSRGSRIWLSDPSRSKLLVVLAALWTLVACGGGNSSPSVWDSLDGNTPKQIADRIKCTDYSENRGPTFDPDEPADVIAVGACNLPYETQHGFVVLHVYPDRASGTQMRTVSEDVNGKGSTV